MSFFTNSRCLQAYRPTKTKRMESLCINCAKDLNLISFINQHGVTITECSICNSKDVLAIDQENHNIEQLIRALIRFNADEWDYNTHVGGDQLESFMISNKLIFSDLFYDHIDNSENFLCSVISNGYYDSDKGISLFYGHTDDGQIGGFLTAIKDSSSSKKNEIINLSKKLNYSELLESVANTIEYCNQYILTEPEKLKLYRARIGVKEEGYPLDEFDFRQKKHFKPFEEKEIGAAPMEFVTKGRMNREGFSFLYLAEDYNTAIHEVRPSPGDYVSIGTFNQVKDLKIADFSKINIIDFCENDDKLQIFEELYDLNKFLSNPIGTNQGYQYLYTQLLSEELIRRGYNGIKFISSLTGLGNFAIFNPKYFEYDSTEKYVFQVNQFIVKYEKMEVMNNGRQYSIR